MDINSCNLRCMRRSFFSRLLKVWSGGWALGTHSPSALCTKGVRIMCPSVCKCRRIKYLTFLSGRVFLLPINRWRINRIFAWQSRIRSVWSNKVALNWLVVVKWSQNVVARPWALIQKESAHRRRLGGGGGLLHPAWSPPFVQSRAATVIAPLVLADIGAPQDDRAHGERELGVCTLSWCNIRSHVCNTWYHYAGVAESSFASTRRGMSLFASKAVAIIGKW